MRNASDREASLALEPIYREPGHACHGYGNVVIVVSIEEPDSAYMERNAIGLRRYATKHPRGLGALVLVPEDSKPPAEPARRALRAGYTAVKDIVKGGVLVIEGQGFAASAKRSVFTILTVASVLPFPMKVAGTPAEGAATLVKLLGPLLDPQVDRISLAAAAEQARRLGVG